MLVTLSVSDKLILDAMCNVVDGIAAMYGQHTEVALHSLDIENPSIIKIANGHVTERGIGAPITNLALEKLKTGADVSEPYFSRCSQGKLIRSVTTIIRNDVGTAIALLCINADMDAPIHSFLSSMLPNTLPLDSAAVSPETFAKNPDEMLNDSIERIKNATMEDKTIPTHKRSRVIVEQLFENGVFNIKDAIVITAESLGVSRDTVYRYLRDLKK
ncbi:helix-turn-helix transcriptional regulator [Photobacterium sanguinicancri]|uniref:helix-turn-helix transcriptional regulator n=1 Tax=Photobacterium sanguinicancri TaxID=875932 RepID=UPI0026E23822|nr:PAS domain-containing protein [Photobacterium sanguinicancri]MDO6497630.1 PAS domain-containing protein [Photobacterium sanguinicancri]